MRYRVNVKNGVAHGLSAIHAAIIAEGKECEVEIYYASQSRTLRQNNFFHSIVGHFRNRCMDTGHIIQPDQAKQIFKLLIGWYDVVEGKKEKYKLTKQTASLTKEEFSSLIDAAEKWWIDWYGEPLPIKWNE